MVHLAEGIDTAAAQEFQRFESLGCLRDNTVLVHGVALTSRDWALMMERGASLVWCPASNAFLFGSTAPVRQFLDLSDRSSAHVCLGSDSRVTGARDLLDELRSAAAAAPLTPCELLRMVTDAPARILRLTDAGRLAVGGPADLIVVPPVTQDPAGSLLATRRHDLSFVAIGGRPVVGSPDFGSVFRARRVRARSIIVDGVERLAAARLATAIAECPIAEPGVRLVS
jgi:cytosine/adenosine deaminase-related metal-dependent hydrolase